jgi:hypothetical protein
MSVTVLSYNEIVGGISVESLGTVEYEK